MGSKNLINLIPYKMSDKSSNMRFSIPFAVEIDGKSLFYGLSAPGGWITGDYKRLYIEYEQISREDAFILIRAYHDFLNLENKISDFQRDDLDELEDKVDNKKRRKVN